MPRRSRRPAQWASARTEESEDGPGLADGIAPDPAAPTPMGRPACRRGLVRAAHERRMKRQLSCSSMWPWLPSWQPGTKQRATRITDDRLEWTSKVSNWSTHTACLVCLTSDEQSRWGCIHWARPFEHAIGERGAGPILTCRAERSFQNGPPICPRSSR